MCSVVVAGSAATSMLHKMLEPEVEVASCNSTAQKDRASGEKGPATELELGTYIRCITKFQSQLSMNKSVLAHEHSVTHIIKLCYVLRPSIITV